MSRDAYDALLGFINADQGHPIIHHIPERHAPVITIARDHGAGGEEIARLLAEKLHVPCYDKEIIDRVVAAAEKDASLMRSLDEKVPSREGLFLFAVMLGIHDPLTKYQRLVTRVVNAIPFEGGIIVGRGANYVLHDHHRCLRVRVVGSEEACARRLGGSAKLAEVREINAGRARFHKDVFNADSASAHHYDLTVNTDRFDDLGKAAELIIAAYDMVVGEVAKEGKNAA